MKRLDSNSVQPVSLRPNLQKQTALSSPGALALCISAALIGSTAMAQDDSSTEAESGKVVLDTLQIEERTIDTNPYAEAGAPYKARISGDDRNIKPIAETPKTISVLTETMIEESGSSDLRDILVSQPGITLGTGENGNAFGDRYIIRGHEARSDVFVDGLRDPGMTTRESFATQQVEITKGPSSTFAGRGSTGGAINSITKQASTEYDFTQLQAGIGTDDYGRITIDSNQTINDDLAVRINALYHDENVPEREPASRERQGLALSGAFAPTDQFSIVADYYYLDANDKPDLGTWIVPDGGKPVKNIPVYLQKQDFLKSEINTGTLRVKYEFNYDWRIENVSRYGTTENGYVTTGARGTNRAAADPIAPGAATASLSTHQGWQDVKYFVNQSNLFWDTEIAGSENAFLFSLEYSDLSVLNGVYNVENTGATNCVVSGRGGANPGYCMYGGDGEVVDDLNGLLGRVIDRGNWDSDYSNSTWSLAVMDTIEFNDRWSLFLGVRLDEYDYNNDVVSTDRTTGDRTIVTYKHSDTLWNYHGGLVFNLTQDGNIYFTYSTSSNINGGESDVGGSCGYGGLCGDTGQVALSLPETTENLELGTKWNLVDGKLLATASIFQVTKSDVMESVGDDYQTLGTLNTGKNRVKGVEFSLIGNLTDTLSAQAGAAFMNSEVLQAYNPTHVGKRLSNFANNSVFGQLRWQATDQLSVGTTVSYSSKMYAGQPDSAASFNPVTDEYSYEVPSYTTMDLFATYDFSEQLFIRLNIGNVTDKDYYMATYRSGAFTYLGDGRNARLTLGYEF